MNIDLTIQDLVDASGLPVEQWPGKCATYASIFVDESELDSKFQYGHWVGPIHKDSLFGRRHNMGFCNHAWVKLADGSIVDPTRWAFEMVEPYIYHGPNDFYDYGGNQLRGRLTKPYPEAGDAPLREVALEPDDLTILSIVSKGGINGNSFTIGQLLWIANLPYDDLMNRNRSIYSALSEAGLESFIPIDNYRLAMEG